MAQPKNTFYVTTPIYYVTAQPHLGSLYSTLLADVVSRWEKLAGKELFFLTGTDEHGQKIAQAAQKAGKEPKEFVDNFVPSYKEVWRMYEVDYNYFIRTTDESHKTGAQQFIQELLDSGAIYTGLYEGWYCTPCETFITQEGATKIKKAPSCPSCQRETSYISEKTYFFKLSAYQDKLLQFYRDNPNFIAPKERLNEVIRFVESGLKDLSISRTAVSWGVPFPHDPTHTIYVWVEALCNYVTAIGYGDPAKKNQFHHWWPANLHVIGKDIVRFHAVYWPALLMAAKLALPKQILVHGWIKVNKKKMSKSLGNVVDPVLLYDAYGPEPVRYFLLRQIPINQDGNFNIEDLENRISVDLANDLGNLLQRMAMLAKKYNIVTISPPKKWSKESLTLYEKSLKTIKDVSHFMHLYLFHLAFSRLWEFIKQVNIYFNDQKPWKLASSNKDQFVEVLAATCHSLYVIGILLWPVMPDKMATLLASLGITFKIESTNLKNIEMDTWNKQFTIKNIPPLFKKPIKEKTKNDPI